MTCSIRGNKNRNVAAVVAIAVLVVLVLVAVLAPILVLAVQRQNGVLVVSTFGDSITDVGSYGSVMDQNQLFPFGYQATMYTEFKQMGIQSKIHNYGIGGQFARQIVDRLPTSVPADYITILAGVNDVNTADYVVENATQILTDSIVQTMTDGVNSVLTQRPPETKVVIGTIPPFCTRGGWGQLEAKRDAIVYINKRLRSLVVAWNNTRILLADVFSDMVIDDGDGWRLEVCCPQDRLHFTPQADIICGQAFSRAIRRDWLSSR
jgi:lysophospholipase L1-like esterase